MLISYLSLFVCIVGGVLFLVVKNNGDVKAMAKDCFWVGLFVFLLQVGSHQVSFLR